MSTTVTRGWIGEHVARFEDERFLKGEDCLTMAWAGPAPVRAADAKGTPVPLPDVDPRRDGSGVPLAKQVATLAGPV